MLPEITQLEINLNQEEDLPTAGKSFLFDFTLGEFVLKDGKLVELVDTESIKMWIQKVLRTEKFRFKVYEDINYGLTIEDLIVGHDYSQAFIESEIKREVTEALSNHPMIQSLTEWEIVKDNPTLRIAFTVNLVNGQTITEVVNF